MLADSRTILVGPSESGVRSLRHGCLMGCNRGVVCSSGVLLRVLGGRSAGVRRRHSVVSRELESAIRVDHAGEFGADRIYAGQMAVLGESPVFGPKIKEMWEQEKGHRAAFEGIARAHRVRPTALLPVWDAAGWALGAGTALLGPKAAMACTVAVESVIVEHYNEQLRSLVQDPTATPELLDTIRRFRDEEQEHHDTGIEYGAREAPFYETLSAAIKLACKTAIQISKVV